MSRDCPTCDAALDRSAHLVVQLRKTAGALHTALRHRGADVFACSEPVCRESVETLQGTKKKRP
jgi:hypothetical protein